MMQQWIRKCGLVISAGSSSLDLSQLRITFEIKRTQTETPNQAQIKVYNLSDDTANLLIAEGQRITLEAGYKDNFGVIFDGQCTQIKKGRENGTETYVEINASDGDNAYNFAFVNTTLAAGSSQQDHINVVQKSMGIGHTQKDVTSKKLPRGKVMFGEAKHIMRKSAHANNQDWSIQHGQLQIIAKDNTLQGQSIVLNSKSGMVGGAEQSSDGIAVRALLNPMLKIGALVIIDEKDIKLAKIKAQKKSKSSKKDPVNKASSISHDGQYKIISVTYKGDTYGQDWFSDVICTELGAVKSGKEG